MHLDFIGRPEKHSEVEVLRFTRVLFGLMPSPFLLGGVIECHLETWESRMSNLFAELRQSMYVDDLISRKPTVPGAKKMKDGTKRIFQDAKFTLHKWHSNVAELEESERGVENEGTLPNSSLAKQKQRPAVFLDSRGTNKEIR